MAKTSLTLMMFPDTRGSGTCRSCGAALVWAELTSGRKHPFNAPLEPPEAQRQVKDDKGRTAWAIDGAHSHFATCPDAKQWSKPKVKHP